MFGKVDFPWTLWFVDLSMPESSFSVRIFIQLSANSKQNLCHYDKVQFLVLSAAQNTNSQKCNNNLFSVKFSVQRYQRVNKLLLKVQKFLMGYT
jgi:hypothetical protein